MKRKTWFHYLPWAGNGIKYPADDLLKLENELISIKNKVAELEKDIQTREKELLDKVKQDWSEEEIEQAKTIYKAHGN